MPEKQEIIDQLLSIDKTEWKISNRVGIMKNLSLISFEHCEGFFFVDELEHTYWLEEIVGFADDCGVGGVTRLLNQIFIADYNLIGLDF